MIFKPRVSKRFCEAQPTHQDGSEHGGADALGHLVLALLVGPREVVLPPGAEHPKTHTHTVLLHLSSQDFRKATLCEQGYLFIY